MSPISLLITLLLICQANTAVPKTEYAMLAVEKAVRRCGEGEGGCFSKIEYRVKLYLDEKAVDYTKEKPIDDFSQVVKIINELARQGWEIESSTKGLTGIDSSTKIEEIFAKNYLSFDRFEYLLRRQGEK